MESSDSEEDDLPYWNNWLPSTVRSSVLRTSFFEENSNCFLEKNNSKLMCTADQGESSRFGNWIPPLSFSDKSKKNRCLLQRAVQNSAVLPHMENIETKPTVCMSGPDRDIGNEAISWKKKLNSDWGKGVQLHDVSHLNDGDLIWGIVNVGVFGHIKLWNNEYGHVCGSAEGTVSKIGSPEVAYISLTDPELMRKMLNLSNTQWVSLCEIVQETKCTLRFDAFQDCDLRGKSSLEKLWFFLCKRRHFLPGQCILVKLSGAIKCLRQLRISSKLIVQDIRNFRGQLID